MIEVQINDITTNQNQVNSLNQNLTQGTGCRTDEPATKTPQNPAQKKAMKKKNIYKHPT